MALTLGQVTVSTQATVLAASVPPGSLVTLAVPASGQTVFVGTASGVTTGNGFPVVSGGPPVAFPVPVRGAAAALYGIVAATTQVIGVGVSSNS